MNTSSISKRTLREPLIETIREHGSQAKFFGPIAEEFAEAARRGFKNQLGTSVTLGRIDEKRRPVQHPDLIGRHFDVVPLGV